MGRWVIKGAGVLGVWGTPLRPIWAHLQEKHHLGNAAVWRHGLENVRLSAMGLRMTCAGLCA